MVFADIENKTIYIYDKYINGYCNYMLLLRVIRKDLQILYDMVTVWLQI